MSECKESIVLQYTVQSHIYVTCKCDTAKESGYFYCKVVPGNHISST